jgi:hypothetical protein
MQYFMMHELAIINFKYFYQKLKSYLLMKICDFIYDSRDNIALI